MKNHNNFPSIIFTHYDSKNNAGIIVFAFYITIEFLIFLRGDNRFGAPPAEPVQIAWHRASSVLVAATGWARGDSGTSGYRGTAGRPASQAAHSRRRNEKVSELLIIVNDIGPMLVLKQKV